MPSTKNYVDITNLKNKYTRSEIADLVDLLLTLGIWPEGTGNFTRMSFEEYGENPKALFDYKYLVYTRSGRVCGSLVPQDRKQVCIYKITKREMNIFLENHKRGSKYGL